METLLVCGYFAQGELTEATTVAAAALYRQEPRVIYAAIGTLAHWQPRVADVMKRRLIALDVPEQHIKIYPVAKDTIGEILLYDAKPPLDVPRNVLAVSAQHQRLNLIMQREMRGQAGRILSTEEVLEEAGELELLQRLTGSRQHRWYSEQEEKINATLAKNPWVYDVVKFSSKVPFKGDLHYLSYQLYR